MKLLSLSMASALVLASVGCGGGGSASSTDAGDTTTIAAGHQMANAAGWYDDAVIYEVWVKAFNDGINQDGIGDLPGLEAKLDYLQDLGVNTLWLSPIFACFDTGPDMHGYDITDYKALNPIFGTNADLATLIDDVHGRGMRILFDFVPNHTSTRHSWFLDGATSGSYYVWQGSLPSGWGYPWGGGVSADVWLEYNGGYYYSAFGTNTLADLDYYNPDVVAAVEDVETYWLDRGFDGFREDSARYLCESGPGEAADTPDTHVRNQGFRAVLDTYAATGNAHPHPGGDPSQQSVKVMIAEAWTNDASGIGPYYGNGSNEFNMCLDFSDPWAIYNAISQSDAAQLTGLWDYEKASYPAGYRSATFDSNHDNLISRPGTQYGGDRVRIIQAEALNLLSPGTPIIYYGNEVGMTGLSGDDINLRQPMDWSAVTAQSGQSDSILSWCKYLIKARTAYPSLRGGYATLTTGSGGALAYVRDAGAERTFVVANLTGAAQDITITDLTSHGVAAGAAVNAILGATGTNSSLNGTAYTATSVPPHGVRVYYAAGGAFQGNIHGDIQ